MPGERESYVSSRRRQLLAWKAEIAHLEAKAERLSPPVTTECYRRLQKLRQTRNQLDQRLEDLRRAPERARSDLERDMAQASQEFDEALASCDAWLRSQCGH